MSGRERRKKPERESKSAIEQLKAAREGNAKRSQQYEVRDESVYDEVDDLEYSSLMAKKRKREGFVVDDEGLGYDDRGEEDWNQDDEETFEGYEEAEVDGPKKPKKTSKSGEKKTLQKKTTVTKENQRLTSFLGKSSTTSGNNNQRSLSSQLIKSSKPSNGSTAGTDDAFESLLQDLVSDPTDRKRAPTTNTASLLPKMSTMTNGSFFKPQNTFTQNNSGISTQTPSYDAPPPDAFSFDDVVDVPFERKEEKKVDEKKVEDKKEEKKSVDSNKISVQTQASAVQTQTQDLGVSRFTTDIPDSAFMDFDETPKPHVNGNTKSNGKVNNNTSTPTKTVNATFQRPILNQNRMGGTSDWFALSSTASSALENVSSVNVSDEALPNPLPFYWIDACEDTFNNKDTVFLFGKIWSNSQKKYLSTSVSVSGINRVLYACYRPFILDENNTPTNQVPTEEDVTKEILEFTKNLGIKNWRAKEVKKTYPFDGVPEIPKQQTTFLKIRYSFKYPSIPTNTTGKTFSTILGTKTTPTEVLILKKRIMGPSWLMIKDFSEPAQKITHCKREVAIDNITKFTKDEKYGPAPPMVVLSLNIKTILDEKSQTNEIVLCSGIVHNSVNIEGTTDISAKNSFSHFSAIRKLNDVMWPPGFQAQAIREPSLEVCKNERHLLSFVLNKFSTIDPDIIVGHNFWGFDLDVLLHRMQKHDLSEWSKLGRLKRSKMPKLKSTKPGHGETSYAEKSTVYGRLVCDTYLSSKEFLRQKTYKLADLAKSQLGIEKPDIDLDNIHRYLNEIDDIQYLIKYTENDCYLALKLMFQIMVLPLTKQLTNLAGNLWSHTLQGGRAERIEFLLLHEFKDGKNPDGSKYQYILPEKETSKERDAKKQANQGDSTKSSSSSKRKPAYSGGLVLDPIKGLYDKYVLLLDFNSLYPSIIQEYNICFTTIERNQKPDGSWEEVQPPDSGTQQGVLPKVLKGLVERRREVKRVIKTIKDPVVLQQKDIQQQALKLTANSMYGCLGFTYSRFYAMPLAELVTRKGRETLQKAVDITRNQLQYQVIYGDTDSIMIHTGLDDYEQALKIGEKVKAEINKQRKLLEIEIDGVFKTILLLKKKKYAALQVEKRGEELVVKETTKGLDLVRRDWCDLSRNMGSYVLGQILSGKSREEVVKNIHEYLKTKAKEIQENKISLKDYIINKGLSKAPEDYPDAKAQPHVKVALAMKKQNKPVQVGDTIPYVIAEGDSTWVERAHHPDDIVKSDGLIKIDTQWYLTQQVLPPISRLCENIEGTDNVQLANCLGLDGEKYNKHVTSQSNEEGETPLLLIDEEERYKDVEKFKVKCLRCGKEEPFVGPIREISTNNPPTLTLKANGLCCGSCEKEHSTAYLLNCVDQVIRKWIGKYYEGWMCCDEQSCQNRTRQVYLRWGKTRCTIPGCKGVMKVEFTEDMLYNQLMSLRYLFDVDRVIACKREKHKGTHVPFVSQVNREAFLSLKTKITDVLDKSAYNYIPLEKLFSIFS